MTGSRRDFFRTFPAWTGLAASLQAAAKDETGREGYWGMVKRQFPLEAGLVYLNAANVCPASRPVLDRYAEYLRDFQANPSFQNREKYAGLEERVRTKLGALLGVSGAEIAIARNTSEGSNIIVRGIDLKQGDEILITDHNHPSNNDSWKVRAKREGLTVKSVAVPAPAPSREALIDGIEKAITPRTKVIAITHVTNTTGVRYPAKEIADLARRRGIWMHLDGAQTCGALDVNLREIGCDSYSASAHKWLMGPLEAGLLYVRADRIPQVWPSIVTAGWAENLKGALKLEVFGQRDNPRIVAVEAAVDFLNLIGMKNVETRLGALTTHLKRKLMEVPKLRMKTNLEPELSGGVIKFQLGETSPRRSYDLLWKRHRIGMAHTESGPWQGLRFSPHVYNSLEEMDQAAAAVREVMG